MLFYMMNVLRYQHGGSNENNSGIKGVYNYPYRPVVAAVGRYTIWIKGTICRVSFYFALMQHAEFVIQNHVKFRILTTMPYLRNMSWYFAQLVVCHFVQFSGEGGQLCLDVEFHIKVLSSEIQVGRKWWLWIASVFVLGRCIRYILFYRNTILDFAKMFCHYFSPNYW
jgi:hypothetical protein